MNDRFYHFATEDRLDTEAKKTFRLRLGLLEALVEDIGFEQPFSVHDFKSLRTYHCGSRVRSRYNRETLQDLVELGFVNQIGRGKFEVTIEGYLKLEHMNS